MGKLYRYEVDDAREDAPAKLMRLVGTGKTVLEVGCSSGSQSRTLSERLGCRVYAVEIDPQAAEHARPHCAQIVVGSIETMDAEALASGAPYDVVLFADVLEHLHDPLAAIEKVRPLLAPGGCVLASIPNVTHAALVFEMMQGRFEYRDYGLLDATHLRFFDRAGVLRLFEKARFHIDHLDTVQVRPADTEFATRPGGDADQAVFDYMRRRNPDSETFQFIVKAYPAATEIDAASALLASRRHVEELEHALACSRQEALNLRATLARRESELRWLGDRPWVRLARDLRARLAWLRPSALDQPASGKTVRPVASHGP